MIYYFIIFIIGLIIGSFLNSVIYRLDNLESIFRERSHCPHCQKQLKWFDLIPLISYLLLYGQCRFCQKKISWQYPVVELATAILFIIIYAFFGLTLYSIILLILSCFLMVIFVYDLYYMIIPDEMIWPAIIITLLLYCIIAYSSHAWQPLGNALLASIIGAGFIGLIVLATRGKGMGIGDIKLAGLIGLMVSYPGIILALFLAFIAGSLAGAYLILSGKRKLKSAIPFGPFLIIGLYLTIFWGEKILNWYLKI